MLDYSDYAVRIKDVENGNIDWVHRRHVRKLKPRPEHLEIDSDDECAIENVTIENPVVDSSTGGGDAKVDQSDMVKIVDEPKSKKRSKKIKKKTIVPANNSRPKRDRKPPDRLNIGTTKGRSYANVVAGL